MQHQFHPVANIFPLMLESEIAELAKDIAANGLREEIWLDTDGKIIDGRNRYVACQRAGVEPVFRTYDGNGSLVAFVVSLNLHRRHLSESQRAHVAAQIANMERGGDRSQSKGEISPLDISTEQAAEMLNVSRASVVNARTVLKNGTPDEVEAVKAGEVAVGTLAKDIRKGVPPEERGKNKPKAKPTIDRRARIATPEGETVEDMCRRGLCMQESGATTNGIATELGVSVTTWACMRDIVLLADRADLSEREQKMVDAALAEMNETRRAAGPHASIENIANRVWGTADNRRGRKRGDSSVFASIEARRNDAFERAFGIVISACMNASLIEIPHFSKERADSLAAELQNAIGSVRALRQRILEIHQ